jgi:mannose-6-phosphate isomerase
MDLKQLSQRPLLLELNRVERFYTGGKLLDRWQGLPDAGDSNRSEEFLMSTTGYMGHSRNITHGGFSRTRLDDGGYVSIKDLIQLDQVAFLGQRYVKRTDGQSGISARIGDSTVRLVIQVHPDSAGALKYLNFPSGKTEAWYIVDSRVIDGVQPYVFAGFKPGITKEHWRRLFDNQDINGMMASLHRIDVRTGDTILIPAGMPHAMGSGCLFLEIHEACDYTIRLEKSYLGFSITDEQLHYGIGYDAMFELFHYDTWDDAAIRQRVIMPRTTLASPSNAGSTASVVHTRLVDYSATDRFQVDALALSGPCSLPDFDGHYIAITTKGQTELRYSGGSMMVPQGRAVFIPAAAKDIVATGDGELVLAYPFLVT